MIKKIAILLLVLVSAILIAVPLVTYNHALSLLDSMPSKAIELNITNDELQKQWSQNEPNVQLIEVHNITPFWFYKWLSVAVLNDFLSVKGLDPHTNSSLMASQIAITHMRQISAINNTKGMTWWHLLHASLSIYIQRNWSATEILAKYNEISS
ncbi:hypothetical protein [Shewanella sp. 4_MG-2023]|uniref:hypothetical protein n=1 Tax=Shewanella sp. 4_MG-2023 TaxID=3062652 RepID=UPI0026E387E4|nr:hypothetical protein [Shewanella sp. 4_MG-2023]MDO6677104.1 hypothetical protein [Shewanella sp. 4_MG-2023]